MKAATELIPWKVTDISIRPFDGFWSFNPSVLFDGEKWICVQRNADYCMSDGKTVRSKGARSTGQQTKNVMVILDPETWKPIQTYLMHERDNYPRVATPHLGFEDMRLFRTDKGGLQGIAASLHLRRDDRRSDGSPHNQPPEQVLLSFDGEYNIAHVHPIRGDGWSSTPQKNWVPFDYCEEPRFLYSIDKGRLFGVDGPIHGDAAVVRPSTKKQTSGVVTSPAVVFAPPDPPAPPPPAEKSQSSSPRKHPDLRTYARGGDVVVRGKRMMLDAMASRPYAVASHPSSARRIPARVNDETTRVMGTRSLVPKYEGLRGGTQLIRVGDDAWLGIGHEMKFVDGRKFYWHRFYSVDSRGKMLAISEPCKLISNGIEFAAGMAIDGDRVVVSFGVDDGECKIGETRLDAVMGMLKSVQR